MFPTLSRKPSVFNSWSKTDSGSPCTSVPRLAPARDPRFRSRSRDGRSRYDEPVRNDEATGEAVGCFRHEALGVVFQVREQRLSVLLWRRAGGPCDGTWALPGGLLEAGERLGASASRHLAAKVDIPQIAHLEQLETRSDPARDPGDRVLATAYLALVTPDARPSLPADTAWHLVDALPPTAFDHGSIVGSARNRLRAKLSYTNIGFALAPETFSISQLRDTYAAALGPPVSATNLQRILTRRDVIEPTSGVARPAAAGGRPATMYRFGSRELVVTNPFAAFRPRAAV